LKLVKDTYLPLLGLAIPKFLQNSKLTLQTLPQILEYVVLFVSVDFTMRVVVGSYTPNCVLLNATSVIVSILEIADQFPILPFSLPPRLIHPSFKLLKLDIF
jgi:hypothetical protein